MRWSFLLLPWVGIACGPQPGDGALVLLDATSRAAQVRLTLGSWSGAPTTPIAVNAWDDVIVTTQQGDRHLPVERDTVMQLAGANAAVTSHSLPDELDVDALEVDADATAAGQLARILGATLTEDSDSHWLLRGTDVLRQSAWLAVPEGVRAVRPHVLAPVANARGGGAVVAVPVASAVSTPSSAFPGAVHLIDELPAHVGVYSAGNDVLVLDASGGFTMSRSCNTDSAGHFFVEGNELVLVPEVGDRRALSLDETGQALSDGLDRFVSVIEVKQ